MSCGLSIERDYWITVFFAPLGWVFGPFGGSFSVFWPFFTFISWGYLLRDFNVSDYFFQILEHCLYALKWLNSTKILYMQRYHETDGPTGQHLHFQSSNGAKTENADIYMFQIYIFQDPLSCSMESFWSFWSQLISVDQC